MGITIQAIGFDYGGVIGGGGKTGQEFVQEMCRLLNITKQQFNAHYFRINNLINEGEALNWYAFWKIFLNNLKRPEMIDQVMDLSSRRTKDLAVVVRPVLDLVDSLRAKGYKVGLLSNNTKESAKQLRAQGLAKHFDVFHISAETGVMKPKPAAFQRFADELEVSLSKMAFVDDSPKSLSTAKECGFTPILFTTYDKLVLQLKTLGIL